MGLVDFIPYLHDGQVEVLREMFFFRKFGQAGKLKFFVP